MISSTRACFLLVSTLALFSFGLADSWVNIPEPIFKSGAGLTDPFDEVDIGPLFKKTAAHFGVTAFDYFAWIITSNSLDTILDSEGRDLDALADAHLDYFRNSWDAAAVCGSSPDPALPLDDIKQTVVGKLIESSTLGIYLDKEMAMKRSINGVIAQLKQVRPELNEQAVREAAMDALEYILNAACAEE